MLPRQLSRISLLLITFLFVCSFTYSSAQQNAESLVFHASVTDDKGRLYSGLKAEYFSAWIDKEPVKITSVGVDQGPATIGLILDTSGSIAPSNRRELNAFWRQITASVQRFMEASNQENDYFAVVFDETVSMTKSWSGTDSPQLGTLTSDDDKPIGTTLYDALYYGIQNVINGRHSRRVVLILSDGQDNNSKRTFMDVRDLIKKSDVTVYAIGMVPGLDGGRSLGMEGQGVLEELARLSGGRALFVDQHARLEVLNQAFAQIALEIQNQYRVSVETQTLTGKEKWRKLRLKLDLPKEKGRPKLYVRTREGYYQ